MTRSPDPGWVRAAQTVYDACLWLYPKPLRDAHGDEMRQAFRDRCHEVARGERSAFRLFIFELVPDTLRSVGEAHLSEGLAPMQARQIWLLGLLCLSLLGLVFRDGLSGVLNDQIFKAKNAWQQRAWLAEITNRQDTARRLAEALTASGSAESKALAAYLHYSIQDEFLGLAETDTRYAALKASMLADGTRATALATELLGKDVGIYPLVLAVRSCDPSAGCDRGAAIGQLTRRDPENAYSWGVALAWAATNDDDDAMRRAIVRMAQSRYFHNYQARIYRDLFQTVQSVDPGDIESFESILSAYRPTVWEGAHSIGFGIFSTCRIRSVDNTNTARLWLEEHPDLRPDCLRIAKLLSGSTDAVSASWGWRMVYTSETDPQAREIAKIQLRNHYWLQRNFRPGINHHDKDYGWDPWSLGEWQQWEAAWAAGDGEIPALKRWLGSRAVPVTAPTDYELPFR